MNDFGKWLLKFLAQGIVWVFLLSINIGGSTLFDRAYSIFVQNALVQSLDEEMASIWFKISKTADKTFAEEQEEKM